MKKTSYKVLLFSLGSIVYIQLHNIWFVNIALLQKKNSYWILFFIIGILNPKERWLWEP